MAKKKTTRIADWLAAQGLSYEKGARLLTDRGVEISGGYLGMLARGDEEPSLKLAREMAKVIECETADLVTL